MTEETVETFVLVVMEHASEWPAHVTGGVAGCIALVQEPNELRSELLRRTYERVRTIERAGGVVEVAVLTCSDDPSVRTLEGRVPLARTLLSTVLHAQEGRLDLVARASAPDRTKQSLVALAGTLTEALVGKSASVSARFWGGQPSVLRPARDKRHPGRTAQDGRSAA